MKNWRYVGFVPLCFPLRNVGPVYTGVSCNTTHHGAGFIYMRAWLDPVHKGHFISGAIIHEVLIVALMSKGRIFSGARHKSNKVLLSNFQKTLGCWDLLLTTYVKHMDIFLINIQ